MDSRNTEELISIVVPVYNAQRFIRETVETVRKQTYSHWELLLIDDCSTDHTPDILSEYKSEHIRVIRQEKNRGAAQARNRGLQEARGRYLAFLDADDLWSEFKLERTLSFLKEKSAAFAFTTYEFAGEDGTGNGKVAHVPPMLTYRQALKNTIIFTSTVMFDLQRISREELNMPSVKSEDTATWWRILKSGTPAFGLDEVLVYYRRTENSLSSNKLEAVRRIWNLYRKQEKLSLLYSAFNFVFYAYRTVRRRI